jgi:hypothetical protein
MTDERRGEILRRYASTSDPRERQRLAREWLDAGGREVIDRAAERGLASLRRPEDARR